MGKYILHRRGRGGRDFSGLLLHNGALTGAARAKDKESNDGENTDDNKHQERDQQIYHCGRESAAGCGSVRAFSDDEFLQSGHCFGCGCFPW